MSDENMVGSATVYEIVNKITGEVFPVNKLGSGNVEGDEEADFIVHKEDGTEVVFKRDGSNENGAIFTNDEYLVREAGTKFAPNGFDVVEDVVPAATEPAPEVSAEVASESITAPVMEHTDTR